MCTDPEGDRGTDFPLKNHKNIGIPSKTCQDPLENHKAVRSAFNVQSSTVCWQADDRTLIVVFGSSFPFINLKNPLSKLEQISLTPYDKFLSLKNYFFSTIFGILIFTTTANGTVSFYGQLNSLIYALF